MKQFCALLVAAVGLAAGTLTSLGQESNTAAAIADRNAAEERFNGVRSDIENLIASQSALRARLEAAEREVVRLREELAQNKVDPARFASAEEVKTLARDVRELAKTLQEIDKNRQADKEFILKQMKADKEEILKVLAKELAQLAVPPPAPAPATSKLPKAAVKDKGEHPDKAADTPEFEYVVKKGDALSKIIAACRRDYGIKVTIEQLKKANPGLNPDTIYEGQKLKIPGKPE